ncbi:MAG: AAA family ATPase [Acidimicrobiales bacterium]
MSMATGGGSGANQIVGHQPPIEGLFVGRHAELAELDRLLARVRSGGLQVGVVTGPAGVGKSALVRHFLAGSCDLEVLWATADEWESRLAYGVVAHLLAGLDVPEPLRGIGAPGAAVPDPLLVGAQLVSVFADLGRPRPLAVVVDDVQWADAASVQALTFTLRRLRSDAVLGLVVAREGLPPAAEGLGRLAAERGARLTAGGLQLVELAELTHGLTGARLSQRAVARLWDHTGGNPLHARNLLDELGPRAIEAAEGPLPAPRSFSMITLARLASCGEPARRLVEAASVLGGRCPLASAGRLAGLSDPGAALEEATAKRLLEFSPSAPGLVGFVHPLARSAVYHDLGPTRRASLHRAASALVDPSARLDHRIAATLGQDPALAAEVEARARLDAARGALSASSGYLVAAARLSASSEERERLTLDALDLLLDAGDVATAAGLSATIDELADSPRSLHVRGRLALLQGRSARAEALLGEAWQRCDRACDPGLCSRISADMAQLCGAQLRAADAAEWARRAIEASDDAEVTAAALGVMVPCLGMVGRPREGLELATSMVGGEPATSVDVEGLLGRGVVRLWIDDLDQARADLLAVVEACRSRPAARPALIALGTLADVEYRTGAWNDSLSHGARAVSLMEDSDQRWLAAFLQSALTWVLAPRGDWPRAEAHADAALGAAKAVGDPLSVFCAAAAGAHVAFFRGDHALAAETLQPLFDREVSGVPEEPGVHAWRHLHAESLLHLGRRAQAEEAVEVLERLGASPERRSTRAHAARLRGLLAAAAGDDDGAGAGFAQAVEQFGALGMPFEAALARDDWGRHLRRLGRRRAARDHLQAALHAYTWLEAEPLAARAEGELAACGLAPDRSSRHHGQLTPQELAVTALVAAGRTNRETAAELVVSVKTVEHHLSAIYAKLGVRSRSELAARLVPSAP